MMDEYGDDEQKLIFPMPEGLQLPQGTAENGTVELLATFKLETGSQMCLKAIEGIPVGAYTEAQDDAGPEAASFEGAVENGL